MLILTYGKFIARFKTLTDAEDSKLLGYSAVPTLTGEKLAIKK
jgi:hypothetical protein